MSNTAQVEVPTGTWKADTVHSNVSFEVPYAVATFSAHVPDFQAPRPDGTLTGVGRMKSLVARDENLSVPLQSPEFFDTERSPEVRFESTAIRRDGDHVEIDGEITIKETTRPVTL